MIHSNALSAVGNAHLEEYDRHATASGAKPGYHFRIILESMTFIPYIPPRNEVEERAESIELIKRAIDRGSMLFAYEKLARKLERWPAHPDLMEVAVTWRQQTTQLSMKLASNKATEMSQAVTDADALCRLLDRLIVVNGGISSYPWNRLPQPD